MSGRVVELTNPYEHDKQAAATGGKLFVAYNCLDCHGADGSGAMGPSFQDGRWHFGGAPGEVFESIYQGRPDGMPAWGGRISNDQIWMLTAYVRSLVKGSEHREFHRQDDRAHRSLTVRCISRGITRGFAGFVR